MTAPASSPTLDTAAFACPRCGALHADLPLRPLTRPGTFRSSPVGPVIADAHYWATCPVTHEPIVYYAYRAPPAD